MPIPLRQHLYPSFVTCAHAFASFSAPFALPCRCALQRAVHDGPAVGGAGLLAGRGQAAAGLPAGAEQTGGGGGAGGGGGRRGGGAPAPGAVQRASGLLHLLLPQLARPHRRAQGQGGPTGEDALGRLRQGLRGDGGGALQSTPAAVPLLAHRAGSTPVSSTICAAPAPASAAPAGVRGYPGRLDGGVSHVPDAGRARAGGGRPREGERRGWRQGTGGTCAALRRWVAGSHLCNLHLQEFCGCAARLRTCRPVKRGGPDRRFSTGRPSTARPPAHPPLCPGLRVPHPVHGAQRGGVCKVPAGERGTPLARTPSHPDHCGRGNWHACLLAGIRCAALPGSNTRASTSAAACWPCLDHLALQAFSQDVWTQLMKVSQAPGQVRRGGAGVARGTYSGMTLCM